MVPRRGGGSLRFRMRHDGPKFQTPAQMRRRPLACFGDAAGLLLPDISYSTTTAPSGLLLAVNEKEGTLSVIDPQRGIELAKIPEGGFAGHEVASSLDGRFAYVPIYGDGNAGTPGTDGREVVKIDLTTRRVVGKYEFDHGVRPHAAVLNSRDGPLYITTELDRTI